jgi:hypothetical protein
MTKGGSLAAGGAGKAKAISGQPRSLIEPDGRGNLKWGTADDHKHSI